MAQVIEQTVRELFERCRVPFPADDVAARRPGRIIGETGWLVWYCFGRDERGEYVDTLDCHRMTNDVHMRCYEDGETVDLPTAPEGRLISPDPAENARLEAEYREQHAVAAAALRAKRFRDTDHIPELALPLYQNR